MVGEMSTPLAFEVTEGVAGGGRDETPSHVRGDGGAVVGGGG